VILIDRIEEAYRSSWPYLTLKWPLWYWWIRRHYTHKLIIENYWVLWMVPSSQILTNWSLRIIGFFGWFPAPKYSQTDHWELWPLNCTSFTYKLRQLWRCKAIMFYRSVSSQNLKAYLRTWICPVNGWWSYNVNPVGDLSVENKLKDMICSHDFGLAKRDFWQL
jgi:hypothetical protein